MAAESTIRTHIAATLLIAALSAPFTADAAPEGSADERKAYKLAASSPNLLFALSTAVLVATADQDSDQDHPTIYELHLGYRLTPKDTLGLKAVTWKLRAPLGIPWGPYLANESEYYPGSLREKGVGLTYQRFVWKGLYGQVQVVPLVKRYVDEEGDTLMGGFRLYTSAHVGYYVPLFRNRLYLEPQVHCNYWPIETRGPQSFAALDAKWDNNFFLFEPNLMVGLNFGRRREEDGRIVF